MRQVVVLADDQLYIVTLHRNGEKPLLTENAYQSANTVVLASVVLRTTVAVVFIKFHFNINELLDYLLCKK